MNNKLTHEQATFQDSMDAERRVTLALAGLTEDALTNEQRTALDAYMSAIADYRLQRWPNGLPHGNVLRCESDAETIVRLAWEEAIKSPFQRLTERVEQSAREFWHDHVDQALTLLDFVGTYEEDNATQLDHWQIHPDERLFEVQICQGYKHDHIDYEVWIVLHANDELEVLEARCARLCVNGNDYRPCEVKDSEDLEDLKGFTRRGQASA